MGTIGMAALTLFVVVIFAWIGRIIIIILGGIKFPIFFHKFGLTEIKPIVKLPTLLGEIIFGIIARNALNGSS